MSCARLRFAASRCSGLRAQDARVAQTGGLFGAPRAGTAATFWLAAKTPQAKTSHKFIVVCNGQKYGLS